MCPQGGRGIHHGLLGPLMLSRKIVKTYAKINEGSSKPVSNVEGSAEAINFYQTIRENILQLCIWRGGWGAESPQTARAKHWWRTRGKSQIF